MTDLRRRIKLLPLQARLGFLRGDEYCTQYSTHEYSSASYSSGVKLDSPPCTHSPVLFLYYSSVGF